MDMDYRGGVRPEATQKFCGLESVGVANLVRQNIAAYRNDLITRREDRNPGSDGDLQRRLTRTRGNTKMMRRQDHRRFDERVAGFRIHPPRMHRPPRFNLVNRKVNGITTIRQFVLDDGIHIIGQGGAGGDHHALAGRHHDITGITGRNGRDDRPFGKLTEFRSPQRIAIHLSAIEGGEITIGGDRFRQHPPGT